MIEKIFNDCHGALPMDSLVTLADIYGLPELELVERLALPESPVAFIEYLNVELSDIFYNNESLFSKFFYLKGFAMTEIASFEIEYLKMFQIKERIEQYSLRLEEYQEQGKWKEVFFLADKRILLPRFVQIYRSIPKDQIVDVFSDIWVRSEFGFEMITEDILSYVYEYKELSDEYKERMKKLCEKANDKEFLTVYHGATGTGDDFSWSLDKKVAQWFANRFGNNGAIEEGKVAVEDIVDYFYSRNEEEVLILPKDVKVL